MELSRISREEWYINIDADICEIIRFNQENGKVKRIKLDENKKYTTKYYAQFILEYILEKKPCKLYINKKELWSLGIYEYIKQMIISHRDVIFKEDGKLYYSEQY